MLPKVFDKGTAHPDIAVHGDARDDADFTGDGDRVRYVVDAGGAAAPFTVEATLLFQPIGFRWADNLRAYDAAEPARFVKYFDAMASETAASLSRAAATVGSAPIPQAPLSAPAAPDGPAPHPRRTSRPSPPPRR